MGHLAERNTMMNLRTKLLIAAAAVTAGTLGLAPASFAGEGGVAGSAAFTLNAGAVTGVAAASAIGKLDAVAGATHTIATNDNVAAALGSAGGITAVTTFTGPFTGIADPAAATAQANLFTAGSGVNINAVNGEIFVP